MNIPVTFRICKSNQFPPNFTSSLFNIYLMPRKKLVIDEKHVMSLKVVGLKKLCKKYKLPQRGRKTNLQDRILEHLQLGKYARAVEVKPIKQTTPKAVFFCPWYFHFLEHHGRGKFSKNVTYYTKACHG